MNIDRMESDPSHYKQILLFIQFEALAISFLYPLSHFIILNLIVFSDGSVYK